MTDTTAPGRRIKTADRLFHIVQTIQELDGATPTELADTMDISVSTVHNYLTTLVAAQYVVNNGGVYEIGLRFLDHGVHAQQNRAVYSVARNPLKELAEETGEVIWLMVEEHGYAINIDKMMGANAVQTFGRVGKRSPLHCHAAGKAILAALPPERVTEIITTRRLDAMTPKTITDKETLLSELDQIRDQGYASNDGELIPSVRSVSAPIVTESQVHGAVSIGGPEHKLQGEYFEQELPALVKGVTNEIELKLEYM